jgi:sugar-specific transcriptional regulator TrmB
MNKAELQEFGLSEGESEIYLALLKLGKANVMSLSKKTGRHRTHIYDTIEKLKQKGLISDSIIENKRFFTACSPDNLIDYLKEKQDKAQNIVNELKELHKVDFDEIKVETYKGKAGLKSVLRDILRSLKSGQEYIGYGEGTRFEKILPIFYYQFKNQSKKKNIKLRLILKKGAKISKRKGLKIKYLDLVSPSTTFIYSDKVAIIIWEPFPTAIKIKDKKTAESYKSYFELLWKRK